jgi:Right handed beta helix region
MKRAGRLARLRQVLRLAAAILAVALLTLGAGSVGMAPAEASAVVAPKLPTFVMQRSIVLSLKQIDLVDSHTVIRVIPFDGSQAVTLPQIVAAIGDPSWIGEPQPGIIVLRAALIQSRATRLSVASPQVTAVRLATGLGVFLGGDKATASFVNVTVTSWDPTAGGPASTVAIGRPFILYQDGSRLQFADATVQDLGSNVKGGLGVTWRNDIDAGGATATTFTGDDIGALVSKSRGVNFTDDSFADSAHQGLVLTNKLEAPTVIHDTFRANGGDGMLVSSGVTNAKISGDAFAANGGSGLHLDRVSGATEVTASTAEGNRDAGFSVAGSTGALLQHLTAIDDKVGIELSPGASNTHVDGATLTGNRVGVEVRDAPGVTLNGLTVQGSTLTGSILNTPGLQVLNSTFAGSTLGVELKSSARFVHVDINSGRRGVAIFPGQTLTADQMQVTATHVGLELGQGATATVQASKLLAPVPHSGGHVTTVKTSEPPTQPISWAIIIVGLGLLAGCVLMEVVRHLRERRDPGVSLSADVWNV